MMYRGIKYFVLTLFTSVYTNISAQNIANYVKNGSFEEKYNCTGLFKLDKAIGWSSIDSISFAGGYMNTCVGTVPSNGNTFQYPRTGNAYILTTIYYKNSWIGYLKNRLKKTLISGKVYCVTFHVNICNTSPRGIDGFSAYFGDGTIDTITHCNQPLTYLSPQINNPKGNIITDSIIWTAISGTFVATGNEKYMVIGNFYSDNVVSTASINTPYFPQEWTDVCIDDVSCIEMNLKAYAGPDHFIPPGDSAFIGRQPDFAVDPYCTWYKLPNTSVSIDTISGLWVKPLVTTTYVVRQNLECGTLQWDTVVVHMNPVGIDIKLKKISEQLRIFPVPANDRLELRIENNELFKDYKSIVIINNLAQVVREEELTFIGNNFVLKTQDLSAGVYLLQLKNGKSETVSKRFVVSR